MGSVASALFKTAALESWDSLGRGPTLQRLFGAYGVQDCWAVQRRFRQIDDGDGFVGYDELQQLVSAEEFSLLFLFDLFAQQNALIDVNELLTVICIFSSARLEEKAKFLLAVFDQSKLGVCTGAEIAQICFVVLGAFAKCTGVPTMKIKELGVLLKGDLPDLCPAYREAVRLVGTEATYLKERVIHHSDLESMLQPIKICYDSLPVARPPMQGCSPVPPLTWGVTTGPSENSTRKTVVPHVGSKSRELATKATSYDEPHLAWMRKMDAEPQGALKEDSPESSIIRNWILLHSTAFAGIAKNIDDFKRLFVKSVSMAVGLPHTCIEVAHVTNAAGMGGTALVEFCMQPPRTSSETSFVLLLEQQLHNAHSALRRGPLGVHLAGAQLFGNLPTRMAVPAGNSKGQAREQGVQSESSELIAVPWPMRRPGSKKKNQDLGEGHLENQIRDALRSLEAMRKRTLRAEAAQVHALAEVQQRQEVLDELHLKDQLRQQDEARGIEY